MKHYIRVTGILLMVCLLFTACNGSGFDFSSGGGHESDIFMDISTMGMYDQTYSELKKAVEDLPNENMGYEGSCQYCYDGYYGDLKYTYDMLGHMQFVFYLTYSNGSWYDRDQVRDFWSAACDRFSAKYGQPKRVVYYTNEHELYAWEKNIDRETDEVELILMNYFGSKCSILGADNMTVGIGCVTIPYSEYLRGLQ